MSAEFIFRYNSLVNVLTKNDLDDIRVAKKLIIKYLTGKRSYAQFAALGIINILAKNEVEFKDRVTYEAVRRINDCSDSSVFVSLDDEPTEDEYVKKLVRSYAEGTITFKEFDRRLRNAKIVDTLV